MFLACFARPPSGPAAHFFARFAAGATPSFGLEFALLLVSTVPLLLAFVRFLRLLAFLRFRARPVVGFAMRVVLFPVLAFSAPILGIARSGYYGFTHCARQSLLTLIFSHLKRVIPLSVTSSTQLYFIKIVFYGYTYNFPPCTRRARARSAAHFSPETLGPKSGSWPENFLAPKIRPIFEFLPRFRATVHEKARNNTLEAILLALEEKLNQLVSRLNKFFDFAAPARQSARQRATH